MAVCRVHQGVGAGLDLIGPRVDVVRARAARRDQLSSDGLVGREQKLHAVRCRALPDGPVLDADDVALVAHDTSHAEFLGPGQVRQTAGVLGRASAAGEADVDVDDDVTHTARGSRLDGGLRVDGECDAGLRVHRDERAETPCVDHLVGQQEVSTEPGGRHALALPNGGAGESVMTALGLSASELGGLVRLHVRPQPRPGKRLRHRGQVVLEGFALDEQSRRLQITDAHRSNDRSRSTLPAADS